LIKPASIDAAHGDTAGLDTRPDLHVPTSFVVGLGDVVCSGLAGPASIADEDAAGLDVRLDLHVLTSSFVGLGCCDDRLGTGWRGVNR
jgi:hypothetical protein